MRPFSDIGVRRKAPQDILERRLAHHVGVKLRRASLKSNRQYHKRRYIKREADNRLAELRKMSNELQRAKLARERRAQPAWQRFRSFLNSVGRRGQK